MTPVANLRTLLLAATMTLGASSVCAQDPAKVDEKKLLFSLDRDGNVMVEIDPGIYKCSFENERVRVCEITFKPGARIDLHWHPDRVVYSVGGGTLTVTGPDGKSKDIVYQPGQVSWFTASQHAAVNNGNVEIKLVMVELREPANNK
jgi:quercetin dioxygenase-like cupin family protein